jgi:hypothetical protein
MNRLFGWKWNKLHNRGNETVKISCGENDILIEMRMRNGYNGY